MFVLFLYIYYLYIILLPANDFYIIIKYIHCIFKLHYIQKFKNICVIENNTEGGHSMCRSLYCICSAWVYYEPLAALLQSLNDLRSWPRTTLNDLELYRLLCLFRDTLAQYQYKTHIIPSLICPWEFFFCTNRIVLS